MPHVLSSRIFLLFPLPFIALLLASAYFDTSRLDFQTIDFVSETLFLGSTHTYLSFGILLLPAAAQWLRERRSAGRNSVAWTSVLLCGSLFAFFYWRGATTLQTSLVRGSIIMITDSIFILLLLHHTLWQVKGISLALSQGRQAPQRPLAESALKGSIHTYFYWLLFFASWHPIAATVHRYTKLPFLKEHLKLIGMTSLTCMLIVIALLIYERCSTSKTPWVQGIYLARLLSWALIPISKYGALISLSIHGIEYLFVMFQIYSKESKYLLLKMVVGLLGIAFLMRYAVLEFNKWNWQEPAPIGLLFLYATALTIGTAHYYWDRVLFSMKHPETRAFTGSRLQPSGDPPL